MGAKRITLELAVAIAAERHGSSSQRPGVSATSAALA
jgi:hypothetical protein